MDRKLLFILLSALLLFHFSFLPAQAEGDPDPATLSFEMTATLLRSEKQAAVLSGIGEKSFARLQRGDVCRVIGWKGNFYKVIFKGRTGYIRKSVLALGGRQTEEPLKEELLSELTLQDYVPSQRDAKNPVLKGTLRAGRKLDSLYFFVWDARRLQVEKALFIPLSEPTDTVSASFLTRHIAMDGITGGRKIYVLEGSAGGETTVLFRTPCVVRGNLSEPAHVTDRCRVSSSQVLSGNIKTSWKPNSPDVPLTVEIPPEAGARLMTLEWTQPPASFTVEMYAKDGSLLSSMQKQTGFYADSISLTQDVRKVKVFVRDSSRDCGIICLRVYPEQYAAHAVQQWEPMPEKIDLMAVSAHQDDELLFLGGTVPYSCAMGRKTAMVYLANGGRQRCREALDGMWTAGLRYHPVFFNWSDAKVSSLKASEDRWRKDNGNVDPRVTIVRLIRQYRPDVIVTQDLEGEYGHNQHKLSALLWAESVHLCKDPAFDPESAGQWGVWDVKKMYVHLYPDNQITMDWDQPVDDTSPFTYWMVIKDAYSKHRSQQTAYSLEKHGRWYDNRVFGLYYTSVGPDVKKNDFFENIPGN